MQAEAEEVLETYSAKLLDEYNKRMAMKMVCVCLATR
jgi:hypothetical protein